jgi:hypothetical protein
MFSAGKYFTQCHKSSCQLIINYSLKFELKIIGSLKYDYISLTLTTFINDIKLYDIQ